MPSRRGSRPDGFIERMQGFDWGGHTDRKTLWFDGDGLFTDASFYPKGPSPWADAAAYGATGDGVSDSRQPLLDAEAALGAAGGTIHVPPGTFVVGSSLALKPTTHLYFSGGAVLAPANGVTVTIAGTVFAGLHQIFSGAGAVAFDLAQELHPEWWGATATVKTAQAGGAVTSGQTAFTTGGSPAFTAADVGKIVVVLGAGASGAPLVTTVAAFVSASALTLAAAASTTVSNNRWAVGTDQTAAVNACLVASAAGAAVCPVVLSRLYGVSSVKLRALQTLYGCTGVDYCGFVRLVTGADPCVTLDSGVSGDEMRLQDFSVNAMFFGALDGIEIGTASAPLALSNAILRNLLVRNAGGWSYNLRANGLIAEALIAKHDGAPVSTNTTAGGFRFTDTLVYADVLGCTGYYPAGTHVLAAGGGSVYTGIETESGGTFAAMDMVTIGASNVRVIGVYATNPGTCRDVVRIPTGFTNHMIEGLFVGAGITCTNLLNDVDRSYVVAGGSPLAGDTAVAVYRNRPRWAAADVATLQTTTSTSYTDLTTTGPAVTLSPGHPTDQAVEVSADMANSTTGICLMSPALSGGAASDANSCTVQGTNQSTGSRRTGATNQANGATHTAKYRVTSGTGSFSNRRISVEVLSTL